jgi:hypothetical protein
MGRRITEGIFNDKKFIVVDDWKNQRDAHRRLERQWTGTETFQTDPAHVAMDGSARNRSPGTDEAIGPAEEQDDQRSSGRAEPKPGHSVIRVKRSAGKVVEIQQLDSMSGGVEDDEIANRAWELLSTEEAYDDETVPPLEGASATSYRAVTARLNYIGPDRIDVQHATKEAARYMATPRLSHMNGLRKIGKYLAGRPRLINHFERQQCPCMTTAHRLRLGGMYDYGSQHERRHRVHRQPRCQVRQPSTEDCSAQQR